MGHSKKFSSSEADNFEFDDACFRKFYKPLSNLPTPPPSSRTSSAAPESPRNVDNDAGFLSIEYLGPATHLERMLPPGASFMAPSFTVIQDILAQARLPMDTIALAVCILDSLRSNFSLSWRLAFPLSTPSHKRHTLLGSAPPDSSEQHIDAVQPEVIVLAALIIASKFVDDAYETTRHFCSVWGGGIWSPAQVNFTERCIMESMDYRIMPLWSAKHIKQARHDIELARREMLDEDIDDLVSPIDAAGAGAPITTTTTTSGGGRGGSGPKDSTKQHLKSKSEGSAVVGLGLQLTPVDTPVSEGSTPFGQPLQGLVRDLGQETREAFGASRYPPQDYLRLSVEPLH